MSDPYIRGMTIKLRGEEREKYRQLSLQDQIDYVSFTKGYKDEHNLNNKNHYFDEWYKRYALLQEIKNNNPSINPRILKNIVYNPQFSMNEIREINLIRMVPIFERFGYIKRHFNGGKKRSRRKKRSKTKNKRKSKRRYKLKKN